jgi:hypothetical protein
MNAQNSMGKNPLIFLASVKEHDPVTSLIRDYVPGGNLVPILANR